MRIFTTGGAQPATFTVYAGLVLGVSAVSSAAILIRLADAPALSIAAYRLLLASILVVPIGLATDWAKLRALTSRQWGLVTVSAACLAAHFAFWITSLEHTSVASSVIIVTANPVLVAIGSKLLLREGASPAVILGIGMALFGGLAITLGDWEMGERRLYGDFLAFLGAIAVAGYYIAGRSLRERLSLFGYIAPVYGIAAGILLVMVFVTGTDMVGFSLQTYGYLTLIGVVPQLVGHSSLNWSLGYLPATLVSTAVMAEPVSATLLAWAVLDEAPTLATVAGGALVLAGVYVALRRR